MSIEDYNKKNNNHLLQKDNNEALDRRALLCEVSKYLHNLKPVLKEEFDMLERINNTKPNKIFPLKMEALASIYQASDVLYKWYVTNTN